MWLWVGALAPDALLEVEAGAEVESNALKAAANRLVLAAGPVDAAIAAVVIKSRKKGGCWGRGLKRGSDFTGPASHEPKKKQRRVSGREEEEGGKGRRNREGAVPGCWYN